MRAIIISDADARALLDKLELRALQLDAHRLQQPATVADLHRLFHFVVTKWLQEQGADCVNR